MNYRVIDRHRETKISDFVTEFSRPIARANLGCQARELNSASANSRTAPNISRDRVGGVWKGLFVRCRRSMRVEKAGCVVELQRMQVTHCSSQRPSTRKDN